MQENYIINNCKLDNHQMKLVLDNNNSFVIAGAGSGKTLTILGKVNYLIENKICNPENILLISFTNASVNDLKRKIIHNVNIYTFHKLAMHILEMNNFSYNLCDNYMIKYLIKEYVIMCNNYEQKTIIKFLKLNMSFNSFLNSKNFISFCNFIETFINLYKTNNVNADTILKIKYNFLEKKILLIILKIYKLYIIEKNSTNSLDFDDLIIIATKFVNKIKLNYKYIIIDEFQDTSFIRLNLIRKIYEQENSKIIVVGDDWQSIYRFSGCDLMLFLNFPKFFSNVNKIKLINTYRNSQELINIASIFVQKNPCQIKKNLFSKKNNLTPLILVPYKNKIETFKKLLNYIIKKSTNILVLSRNNKDIFSYIDSDFLFEHDYLKYKNIEIKYLTIHKSKGLEADYVIILNCNDEFLGFPNKIENNKIIEKLFPSEQISFSEERRLFYVAITRCKEITYLIYDVHKPSIFVKEIKKIIKKELGKITYFN